MSSINIGSTRVVETFLKRLTDLPLAEWTSVDSVTLLRACNLIPANREFIGEKSFAHLVNGKIKLQSLKSNV